MSEFAGNYSGTILVNISGTAIFGASTGRISASKKKEIGNIALTSTINAGTAANWNETYGIRKHALSYALFISPSTFGPGNGRVNVRKNRITFSGNFTISGVPGATFAISGTMKKSKRRLVITESVTGPTAFSVTYNLRRHGK